MKTEEDRLVDLISSSMRAEVSGVRPSNDLLERVNAQRRSERRPGWSGSRAAGVLGTVVGLAVVVAIVLVISSLRAGHTHATGSGGASTEQAIVARLAVLRRSQTAADRLPEEQLQALQRFEHVTIVPDLTRLITTVKLRAAPNAPPINVYLAVERGTGANAGRAARSDSYIVTTLSSFTNFGLLPRTGRTLVAPGVAVVTGGSGAAAVGSPENVTGETGVFASVVPDGVVRVKWVFSGYDGLRARPGPSTTVYPRIIDNVALTSPRNAEGYLATVTWYGSSGQVIASFSDNKQIIAQQLGYERVIANSATNPIAPQLPTAYTVFRTPPPKPAFVQQPYERWAAALVAKNPYKLNVAQARQAPFKNTPESWVIPGTRGFAILLGPSTRAVGPISGRRSALSDGLVLVLRIGPRVEKVVGLAPNGNRTVTVVVGGGRRWTVKVLDNVYAVVVTGKAKYVIENNAGGQRTTLRAPSTPQCEDTPCS